MLLPTFWKEKLHMRGKKAKTVHPSGESDGIWMVGIWGNIVFFLVFKWFFKFPLVSMECFHNEDRIISWQPPHSSHLAPNHSSHHILTWSHCPCHFGVTCGSCLSLGLPCKQPASSWVLTVFPGNGSWSDFPWFVQGHRDSVWQRSPPDFRPLDCQSWALYMILPCLPAKHFQMIQFSNCLSQAQEELSGWVNSFVRPCGSPSLCELGQE